MPDRIPLVLFGAKAETSFEIAYGESLRAE
jgi:hypothetical protein